MAPVSRSFIRLYQVQVGVIGSLYKDFRRAAHGMCKELFTKFVSLRKGMFRLELADSPLRDCCQYLEGFRFRSLVTPRVYGLDIISPI